MLRNSMKGAPAVRDFVLRRCCSRNLTIKVEKRAIKPLQVKYREMNAADEPEVAKLIEKYFIPHEITYKCLGATIADVQDSYFTRIQDFLAQGNSLAAVDDIGDICGMVMNVMKDYDNEDDYRERRSDKDVLCDRLFDALTNDVGKTIGTNNYWEHKFACVVPDYRNMGLFKTLLSRSYNLALTRGCSALVGISGGYYPQRANAAMGYKTVKKIEYADYVDPVTGKKEFAGAEPPNTCASVMVRYVLRSPTLQNDNADASC